MARRIIFALLALAATACQPAPPPEISLPGARPIAYDAIRDASGVLGFAEPLLGPEFGKNYSTRVGPGSSRLDATAVAGAWELPLTTTTNEVAQSLRGLGTLDDVRDYRDGSIWIADYRTPGSQAVRLLLIDGTNRAFETKAALEVRPGPHIYLIAYRKP